MDDKSGLNLEQAIEQEEARLLERLSDLAEFKRLAAKLNIAVPGLTPVAAIPNPQPPTVAGTSFAVPRIATALAVILGFDGTFASLVICYHNHPDSPYHHLKHSVRQNYDNSFKRIVHDVGSERVADWSAQRIKRVYDESWAADGKIAMGRNIIAKLRLLCTFGSTVLNDDACTRLSAILGNMRFAVSSSQNPDDRLITRDQARAIRIAAREYGWDSIALAQAIQFEFPKLRQMDVIGEWVPIGEPGPSDIVRDNEKWVRGLLWSDLDDNMVLRRVLTSGRRDQQKPVKYSLKRSQMTMEEINRVSVERRNGPMIICEFSGLPWSANEYRRKWRIVADKAGIPASMTPNARAKESETELGTEPIDIFK
jgi:hypothetical protein